MVAGSIDNEMIGIAIWTILIVSLICSLFGDDDGSNTTKDPH